MIHGVRASHFCLGEAPSRLGGGESRGAEKSSVNADHLSNGR
jgi:hypothetical protein